MNTDQRIPGNAHIHTKLVNEIKDQILRSYLDILSLNLEYLDIKLPSEFGRIEGKHNLSEIIKDVLYDILKSSKVFSKASSKADGYAANLPQLTVEGAKEILHKKLRLEIQTDFDSLEFHHNFPKYTTFFSTKEKKIKKKKEWIFFQKFPKWSHYF